MLTGTIERTLAVLMGTTLVAGWIGCAGEAEYGMAVRIAPERRIPVEPGARSYPDAKPFNIHDAQRSSAGDADSQSYARPDGKALCSASAKNEGTAWGEFQLGQSLDNRLKKPAAVLARVQVSYVYSVEASDPASSGTQGSLGLKIYIKDSGERVLRQLDLLTADTELGPAKGRQSQTHEFAVTFEPDRAYQYVLAGRAEAGAAEKTSAATRLEIQSFKIDIETTPEAG